MRTATGLCILVMLVTFMAGCAGKVSTNGQVVRMTWATN